jgi:hypothetical protein
MARTLGERERRVRVAWERFVRGGDDVAGVPAQILSSWYRCRDVYGIDPLCGDPPLSDGSSAGSASSGAVLTQLGGVAATLAGRVEDAVTTVSDGTGCILATWGGRAARQRATASHLAPMFSWSEPATGTNALGTALGSTEGLSSVRGAEHWCQRLQSWSCFAVALTDHTTGQPVAALNVSFWQRDPAPAVGTTMRRAVAPLNELLARQAQSDGHELARVFAEAAPAGHGVAALVVDAAGAVVASNERAGMLADGLPAVPAVRPRARLRALAPRLAPVIRAAGTRSRSDPGWVGRCRLTLSGEADAVFAATPILSGGRLLGLLLVESEGESEDGAGDPSPARPEVSEHPVVAAVDRVVGVCAARLIVLTPSEIRYAEADKHCVWLVTDRGRVRARTRGLDVLEAELRAFGFLRVHRGFLVNVHRVREVEQGYCRGTLNVSTQHHGRESIPVARRHVPALRASLGI